MKYPVWKHGWQYRVRRAFVLVMVCVVAAYDMLGHIGSLAWWLLQMWPCWFLGAAGADVSGYVYSPYWLSVIVYGISCLGGLVAAYLVNRFVLKPPIMKGGRLVWSQLIATMAVAVCGWFLCFALGHALVSSAGAWRVIVQLSCVAAVAAAMGAACVVLQKRFMEGSWIVRYCLVFWCHVLCHDMYAILCDGWVPYYLMVVDVISLAAAFLFGLWVARCYHAFAIGARRQ